MTTVQAEKIARRKLSLLELAQELGNVSKVCRIAGYSRQQFYEIRRNFQMYGAEGLLDRMPGAKGPHPNRVASEVEDLFAWFISGGSCSSYDAFIRPDSVRARPCLPSSCRGRIAIASPARDRTLS